MRGVAYTLAALAAVAPAVAQSDSDTYPLRLITYNIRTKTSNTGPGELHWDDRRPLLATQLANFTEDHPNSLICMQEAYMDVVDDIQDDLGDDWKHVGVGRDDGRRRGESAPIFYRDEEWELEHHQTYWLSEDPDEVGSRGWDAAAPRIVTVAKLKHKETEEDLVYLCTHFDHRGQEAKVNSAKLLGDIAHYKNAVGDADVPVFVGGDLNLRPDNDALAVLRSNLTEIRDLVAQLDGEDNGDDAINSDATFTGFSKSNPRGVLLDYMFVKDPAAIEDASYEVASNIEDDEYVSDHKPIVADFQVKKKGDWEPEETCVVEDGEDMDECRGRDGSSVAGKTGGGRNEESAAQRMRPGFLLLGDLLRFFMPLGRWLI